MEINIEADEISLELKKQNITERVLVELKEKYFNLTVNGLSDKEGFMAVEEARKECASIRILTEKICKKGRESAIKIQKEWIAQEKKITAAILEVENKLLTESNRIKEEKKRIEFEAEQRTKLPLRRDKLAGIDITIKDEELLKLDDQQFNNLFVELYTNQLKEKAEKLEKERLEIELEKEKKRKEEEAATLEAKRKEEIKIAQQKAIEDYKREQELKLSKSVEDAEFKPSVEEKKEVYFSNNEDKVKAEESVVDLTESDISKLNKWIDSVSLSEISLASPNNMVLSVELKAKLIAYKNWAKEQIKTKGC